MYPMEDLAKLANETGDDKLVADSQQYRDEVVELGVKLLQYAESRNTLEEIATVIENEAKKSLINGDTLSGLRCFTTT